MDNNIDKDGSGGAPTFSGTNAGAAAAAAAMTNPVPSADISQKMPNVMDRTPPPMPPSGAAANQHHPVAEFLYQVSRG